MIAGIISCDLHLSQVPQAYYIRFLFDIEGKDVIGCFNCRLLLNCLTSTGTCGGNYHRQDESKYYLFSASLHAVADPVVE